MSNMLLHHNTETRWSRDSLDARRQAIAAAHTCGTTGAAVVAALTNLADEILLDLYTASSDQEPDPTGVALVALGGYGRRELAPYSDIDLMFLYAPQHEPKARALSIAILHILWDLGF
ncbi:MAG TPA: DUF294 nucleotidyltransferase-like domain-containing protein, partial [Nitrospirales bacterium]